MGGGGGMGWRREDGEFPVAMPVCCQLCLHPALYVLADCDSVTLVAIGLIVM